MRVLPRLAACRCESGATVDHARERGGYTPLMFATQNLHAKAAAALLAAGADPNKLNSKEVPTTAVHIAVTYDASDVLAALLSAGGLPGGGPAKGTEPLHMAASQGKAECVRVSESSCSTYGAPLGMRARPCCQRAAPSGGAASTRGPHVSCVACSLFPPRCVRVLLRHGGEVDGMDKQGRTPLVLAVTTAAQQPSELAKHAAVAATLIKGGALIDKPGPDGATPLETARRAALLPIVELLQDDDALPAIARRQKSGKDVAAATAGATTPTPPPSSPPAAAPGKPAAGQSPPPKSPAAQPKSPAVQPKPQPAAAPSPQPSSPSTPAGFTVSGAGSEEVNGFYKREGDYGGAPLFANGTWWLLRYTMKSGNSWWYIADKDNLDKDDGDMYRVQHNAMLPPTDVEWKKAKDGVLPAPTLRAESGVPERRGSQMQVGAAMNNQL